jgi:amino acid adenylation domain-containing protein/non-ribosomal peptide synthase protein (TIGR01720 family)
VSDAPAPLARDAVDRVYRLSPLQAGMLFHDLMTPGNSPYYRQVSFLLEGAVDPIHCEAAWNALLARHAMLRSLFDYERTTQPLQIILKTQAVEFHCEDAVGGAAERWRRADVARGFDLRRDPLMRVALFRHAPDRFEMIWTHPHILIDGWSGSILAEEFAELYAAARRGTAPELVPPVDPDDYMAAVAARDYDAADRHWAVLLQGYDELATLPRLPLDAAPSRHRDHRFRIDAAETAALLALAAANGTTLGVLLQALWGLLLSRWTGRQDVVFGIVTSGRSVATPGIERLVGMFVNSVPVRVRWDGGETIGSLLARLQRQADENSAHDQTGLAAIQAASALPSGLLDHLLVLENFPESAGTAETGFAVASTAAEERANYDFGIIVHAGDALDINLQHDSSRIASSLIARLEDHWRTLIGAVLADPELPLAELDSMPADERRMLADAALGPVVARNEGATLADLWHAQADLTPEALAVIAGGERLTYRALDQAAEGVAQRLRADGIGRDAVVGVLCERSAARIVALLGILKAGAAYLPISPALPDSRIAMMLEDSGCVRLLADGDGLARLDALAPGLAKEAAGPPAAGRGPCPATAGDTAYIIYTSGSTGRPKGVAVQHGGFVNMIEAQIRDWDVRPDDRVVQFASCSFDASLSEIFMALLCGAGLVIASDEAIRDGAALLALFEAEGVTVATLPPSYLRALDGAELAGLRVLITAGEPPDLHDSRHYAARLAAFNAYGPTEASVCASWHKIDPGHPYPDGIPIGRPIANTGMSVRDGLGRPMPPGTVGEIWLSGQGLARGYVGQPALTAERFPEIQGERFYRTGDAGMIQGDGAMIYLGRLDGQIKLNGQRIELGEIEQRLRGHPIVSQAAVVVASDPPGLLAFVVPHGPIDLDALRQGLVETLPSWMVPAEILTLAELPRTIAGKVDRRALASIQRAVEFDSEPLDAREKLVAEAFAAVLGGGPFGRHSSFVASGGDSLRAIRLLGQLRRDGFLIELQDMLAADTVAKLALAESRALPIEDSPVTGPVALTPIQHWFFAVDPEGTAQLNHLILLRALRSPLDSKALATALDAIWRHHDALRLRFRRGEDGWAAECAPADIFQLRTVDCRNAEDPWALIEADAAANQPMGAADAPLFRATLYRLRDADHLLLTAHHLVVDAVSWRIIVEDLGDALRQAAAGQTIHLAAKTGSCRDWAAALAGPDGLAAAERERPYWEAVANAPMVQATALDPHGYEDTELLTVDLGTVEPGISDRTVLAGLLARLGAALRERDDRLAAYVTLASHGRTPLARGTDVSRTAGWFSADYPFLLDCTADAETIEAALAAVPSEGVGWSVLRMLSPTPIAFAEPELSLNYLGGTDMPPDTHFATSDRLPGVISAGFRRTRAIELEAARTGGRLTVSLRYAPQFHQPAAMRALIDAISNEPTAGPLRDLVSEGIIS